MRNKIKRTIKKNIKIISHDYSISPNELRVLSKVLLSLRNENKFETPSHISDFKTDTVYFDVDDTLIKYKVGKKDKAICINQRYVLDQREWHTSVSVVPHKKHIKLLKQLYIEGKKIVVWSAATAEWAETVCKTLRIDHCVDYYLTKPTAYVDDLNITEWAKKRVWFKDKGTQNG